MKKKGLITFISITIIFELIQVLFLREFSNKGIIIDLLIYDLILYLTLIWIINKSIRH